MGHAATGVGAALPAGALMRFSVSSCEMISARAPRPAPTWATPRPEMGAPDCADALVAADVIDVRVGVDDVAHRPRRQLPQRGQHAPGVVGGARVHDDQAQVTDLHGDVRAGAKDRVDVALHFHGAERRFVGVAAAAAPRRRRRVRHRPARCRPWTPTARPATTAAATATHCSPRALKTRLPDIRCSYRLDCRDDGAIGIVFTLLMYSGYIVSAPPRVGSTGNACWDANSVRYGFLPTR